MTYTFTIAELASLTGAKAVEGVYAGPIKGIAALAEAATTAEAWMPAGGRGQRRASSTEQRRANA